jgi:tetratricopeptide (TPR) repeat protein
MRAIALAVLAALLSACALSPAVQAQSPQETLNQYTAALKDNPDDYELRDKIIRHVQTMEQPPAMPEEAVRHMARGAAASKGAKNQNDFKEAVKEFEKASLSAPWLANIYYSLGVAQDEAGMYADAIKSLNLYLQAAPDSPDVKELIYQIEYRQEKAAKDSAPKAITVHKEKKSDAWLKAIDGRRYTNNSDPKYTMTIDVRGKVIVLGVIWPQGSQFSNAYQELTGTNNRFDIKDREFTQKLTLPAPNLIPVWAEEITFIFDEDGESITRRIKYSDGNVRNEIYNWESKGSSQEK